MGEKWEEVEEEITKDGEKKTMKIGWNLQEDAILLPKSVYHQKQTKTIEAQKNRLKGLYSDFRGLKPLLDVAEQYVIILLLFLDLL